MLLRGGNQTIGDMYLICCVDDRMGLSFGKRRISRDKLVILDIVYLIKERENGKIIIEKYSYELFEDAFALDGQYCDNKEAVQEPEETIKIEITDKPLEKAVSGDYCFNERYAPARYADKIEKIILYKWNRTYPATVHFDIDIDNGCWIKEESKDFCGNSHDNITREIWRKAL